MPPGAIRVRFSPSPTGFLHIGGARTALFNWLFARKNGGAFLLRIEDTDAARSEKKYEDDIIAGLTWLGITWDESPLRQSERLDIYADYLKKLMEANGAYHCFCTKEELEASKQAMLAQGQPPRYRGTCRALDGKEVARRLSAGQSSVIRLRMPDEPIEFSDIIRGSVTFDAALIGDTVIAKKFNAPLYNFAAAVDDHESKISHVIRGEEHIANTPVQIAVQRALGFAHPRYAHLPLILNPDRSKMSKRFSATSLTEYRAAGYLPDALANFIALLGWHGSDDRELLSRDELTAAFELERVQKAGAVFNKEKLDWMNAQYLKHLDNEQIREHIRALGLLPAGVEPAALARMIATVRERMHTFADFPTLAAVFIELPVYEPALLRCKEMPAAAVAENLAAAADVLAATDAHSFTAAALSQRLAPLTDARGRGEVLWPLRVALSGSKASPGPFEIMAVIGKDESVRRISLAREKAKELLLL